MKSVDYYFCFFIFKIIFFYLFLFFCGHCLLWLFLALLLFVELGCDLQFLRFERLRVALNVIELPQRIVAPQVLPLAAQRLKVLGFVFLLLDALLLGVDALLLLERVHRQFFGFALAPLRRLILSFQRSRTRNFFKEFCKFSRRFRSNS